MTLTAIAPASVTASARTDLKVDLIDWKAQPCDKCNRVIGLTTPDYVTGSSKFPCKICRIWVVV